MDSDSHTLFYREMQYQEEVILAIDAAMVEVEQAALVETKAVLVDLGDTFDSLLKQQKKQKGEHGQQQPINSRST